MEKFKAKSIDTLFEDALSYDYQNCDGWNPISELRWRANKEIFYRAKSLCHSSNHYEREIGLDIMAQLGHSRNKPFGIFVKERIKLALQALGDNNPDIIESGAWILSHLCNHKYPETYENLITLKAIEHSGTRLAIAYGLSGITDEEAIETLIHLMRDKDDDVRNWATFSLGQGSQEQDTPKIREALRERLSDNFEDVRLEAKWGLAIRHDTQGLRMLIQSLKTEPLYGDENAARDILDLWDEDVSTEELALRLLNTLDNSSR